MGNWRDKISGIQVEKTYSPLGNWMYRTGMNYDYVPTSLVDYLGEESLLQQLDDIIISLKFHGLNELSQSLAIWIADELGVN